MKTIKTMLMTAAQETFFKLVKSECQRYGVELVLGEGVTVEVNGGQCAGFFQDRPVAKLSIAIGKPANDWIEILAHEYCHLKQWVENCSAWHDQKVHNIECSDLLDLWINHQIEFTDHQLNDYINRIIMVEKDCEERTVALIKELNLPIDVENYARKANAYLFFYHRVKKYRKWSNPNISLYSKPEIIRMMPIDFTQNYQAPCPLLLESLDFVFRD